MLADQLEDGAVLSHGDGLALQLRLDSTSKVRLDHLLDLGSVQTLFLGVWVLELGGKLLDDEGGPFGFVEVEGFSVVTELDGVDPDKVNLVVELFGDRSEEVEVLLLVLFAWVEEEVSQGLPTLGIDGIVVWTNLIKIWNGQVRDPLFDIRNLGRSNGVRVDKSWLVESTVEDQGGGCDTSDVSNVLIIGMPKEPVIAMLLGGSAKFWSREVGFGSSVKDGNNLVSMSEFVMFVDSDISYGGKRLLDHVGDDALGLAGTIVVDGSAVAEYAKCPGRIVSPQLDMDGDDRLWYDLRITANVMLLAKVCFVNAIDLCEFYALLF